MEEEQNHLLRLASQKEKIDEELARIDEEIQQLENQLQKPEVEPPKGFENVVVLDGLPTIPKEKMDRLKGVLKKTFFKDQEEIHMVFDENHSQTTSFAFIEYSSPESAEIGVENMNGVRLDKAHKFSTNLYSELEDLTSISEEFNKPDPQDSKMQENLRSWLLDPRPIDQYCINFSDMTEIYWNEPQRQPEPLYSRQKWTDMFVSWSPLGTYMVTVHPQGVQLWGGEKWGLVHQLVHEGVALIHFSPCENFLMTLSTKYKENDNPKDPKAIVVWDVRTGKKRRCFESAEKALWPEFRWSHDDKYFARQAPHAISIYESSSMGLLEKKSLKCPGVREFHWSPTDNVISCWFPESGNSPARVVLYSIPSRKELVSKSLYNVSECHMHWQGAGDYLCVKVDRHTKTKKSTYTNFELFRMRSKNIPVEVLELKDTIMAFAWEPNGHRFAVIHTTSSNQRPDVTFYEMRPDGGVRTLKTLEKRQASHLFWSPVGGFILLVGLRSGDSGRLEFYNVNDLETMATEDHFGCSHIAWDPTGRFVCTSVSCWAHQQMENGYNIWSFQGKLIHKMLKDRFYQFLWRPRPPSLLSKEKEEHIRLHIKEYSQRIAKEEQEEKMKALRELEDKRNRVLREYSSWADDNAHFYEDSRSTRRELWAGVASDEDSGWETYSEEIEEVLSEAEALEGF